VLHGNRTYLLQDEDGQIIEAHSISAGLDYPGIGPEHSWLHDIGRVEYVSATDNEALEAFQLCTRSRASSRRWNRRTHWPMSRRWRRRWARIRSDRDEPVRPRRQGHLRRRRLGSVPCFVMLVCAGLAASAVDAGRIAELRCRQRFSNRCPVATATGRQHRSACRLALPMWPGNSLAPDCVKDPAREACVVIGGQRGRRGQDTLSLYRRSVERLADAMASRRGLGPPAYDIPIAAVRPHFVQRMMTERRRGSG
jgi:hypothetical protein